MSKNRRNLRWCRFCFEQKSTLPTKAIVFLHHRPAIRALLINGKISPTSFTVRCIGWVAVETLGANNHAVAEINLASVNISYYLTCYTNWRREGDDIARKTPTQDIFWAIPDVVQSIMTLATKVLLLLLDPASREVVPGDELSLLAECWWDVLQKWIAMHFAC